LDRNNIWSGFTTNWPIYMTVLKNQEEKPQNLKAYHKDYIWKISANTKIWWKFYFVRKCAFLFCPCLAPYFSSLFFFFPLPSFHLFICDHLMNLDHKSSKSSSLYFHLILKTILQMLHLTKPITAHLTPNLQLLKRTSRKENLPTFPCTAINLHSQTRCFRPFAVRNKTNWLGDNWRVNFSQLSNVCVHVSLENLSKTFHAIKEL